MLKDVPRSRRTRIAMVVTAVWLLLSLALSFWVAERCNYQGTCTISLGRFARWMIGTALLPLAILWGIAWVRRGTKTSGAVSANEKAITQVGVASRTAVPAQLKIALIQCDSCFQNRFTRWASYDESMSFLFFHTERRFQGNFCFTCHTRIFTRFQASTLALTWWGFIGFLTGPVYLFTNTREYAKQCLAFGRHVRARLRANGSSDFSVGSR